MINEEPTNEELKNKILSEFFTTGRIDGLYFGRKSDSKLNPLKNYINRALYRSFILENNGIQDNDFLNDIYSELFYHLSNVPADKFINLYNDGKVPGSRLIAYALRIIILKCFSKDKRNNNPKHALVSQLGFASAFNPNNYQIAPLENNDDEDYTPNLIIYDAEEETEFEADYGFTPEELINQMTSEEQFVFYKLLSKQKPGAKSKATIQQNEKLKESILNLKANIQIRKGIGND